MNNNLTFLYAWVLKEKARIVECNKVTTNGVNNYFILLEHPDLKYFDKWVFLTEKQ